MSGYGNIVRFVSNSKWSKTRHALTQFFFQLSFRMYYEGYTIRPQKAEI